MAHIVDGLRLSYTGRRSWKAKVEAGRKIIGFAPVAWTKGQSKRGRKLFQAVSFTKTADGEAHRQTREPFLVAVATAKDYSREPHEFSEFRAVLEVRATGKKLGPRSIETVVLRRIDRDSVMA
jgi:hypothetical protein